MKKDKQRGLLYYLGLVILWIFMFFFFGLVLGTIAHEVFGHGFTALAFGNQITAVKILILKFDSSGFSLTPFSEFGKVWFTFSSSLNIYSLIFITLNASIIPLIVAIIFAFLLLVKRPKGFRKILFTCFAIWFIDPLCNYFIWPYLSLGGSGSDFRDITNITGFTLLPFTIIAVASALIISSIIIYSFFNSKNLDKFFKFLLILLCAALFLYVTYLIIFGNIIDKGGYDVCKNLEDSKRAEGCAFNLALVKNNVSLCKTFSDVNKTSDCIFNIAYFSENVSLCNQVIIFVDKDPCFYLLAEKTKNLTICRYISNKTYSQECLNQ